MCDPQFLLYIKLTKVTLLNNSDRPRIITCQVILISYKE